MQKPKVSIYGCGNVGVTIAKELLDTKTPMQINIIEVDEQAQALVNDLNQANGLDKTCTFSFNDENAFLNADYIFITFAESATKIGDRLAKAEGHINTIRSEFSKRDFVNHPKFIVITNPVDVITWHLIDVLPKNSYVIGTGTYLETLRFNYFLAHFFETDINNVTGFLLGEHGNSAVPIYSKVTVNGKRLSAEQIEAAEKAGYETVQAAYNIRRMGHYIKYAISKCGVSVFNAIHHKQKLHLPAGLILNEENQKLLNCGAVCLSTECTIENGEITQHSLSDLNENEIEQMKKAAQILSAYTLEYSN